MATVTSATKHFVTAKEGFTTTTSGTVIGGTATTVGLNSVTGYSNGDVVALVIEPTSTTNKQVFTGVVDTSGIQITGVIWTEGTNVTHNAGVTVVDYETATAWALHAKGLLRDHYQSGYHNTLHDDNGNEWLKLSSTASAVNEITVANAATGGSPVISATGDDSNVNLTLTPKGTGGIIHTKRADGWITGLPTPNTVTYNGNRSYSLVFNSTDLTGYISNGMRLKLTRTVTAPTQCTSLNGTNQYYSKTSPAGMTFTNNFVVSAWIKVSSYGASSMRIASRYNGTSGWALHLVASTGQVLLVGYNGGAANYSYVLSYQSVPLNKWVHVTAQLDMLTFTASTTTSYIMIDGVDVPASVARGGTNPTALVQAGDLNIGAANATEFFPGKIAQVAIFNAKVTQATMQGYISQGLAGTETSLISAYSFNNSINDLNANANNLTANGSAVATNADSPFALGADASTAYTAGTTEYGIVTAISFSTNTTVTVQAPSPIPTSGGVSAMSYSTQASPLGFPAITLFKLSAFDTSGTLANTQIPLMVKYIISEPLEAIPYSNSGTAGGTMYLWVDGSTRKVWGQSITVTNATGTATTYHAVIPTGFFTTIQTPLVSMTNLTGSANVNANLNGYSTTDIQLNNINFSGTTAGGAITYQAIGT